jgi:Protein of unknown function (DUF1308)/Family of unknown function (DUF5614)
MPSEVDKQETLLQSANALVNEGSRMRDTVKQLKRCTKSASKRNQAEWIEGLTKLDVKVKSEMKFLEKMNAVSERLNQCHVDCSNIPQLKAILDVASKEQNVETIFKTFRYKDDNGKTASVCVDVVAGDGAYWIKVKSSTQVPQRIEHDKERDDSSPESEDVGSNAIDAYMKQCTILQLAASQNQVAYVTPKIIVKWMGVQSIDPSLSSIFASLCIITEIGISTAIRTSSSITETILLDTTTLIAMVSDLVHRFALIPDVVYDNKHILEQKESEKLDPMLPKLRLILKGRKLLATRTAVDKFDEIVKFIAGDTESARARSLFNNEESEWKVDVVDDDPSDRFKALTITSKFKAHHVAIFGTADRLKCTTITANGGIPKCFRDMGLTNTSVSVHESRSLIERRWIKYCKT